jgi:hypothetical protein
VNVTINEPVAVVVEPDFATTPVGGAGEPTITAGDAADGRLVPATFVAVTLHVYVFAVVTPLTVIATAVDPTCVPVFVTPALLDVHVAVKCVIALPPLFTGATYVTTSEPVAAVVEPDFATTPVGAPGAVGTTNEFDGADAGPVPTPFVAVTVQVYVLPEVKPDTTIGLDAPEPEPDTPAFDDVQDTSYCVIGLPPSNGAVNDTEADVGPPVAVTPVGAPGAVGTTNEFEAADAGPVPTAFVAVTVHV